MKMVMIESNQSATKKYQIDQSNKMYQVIVFPFIKKLTVLMNLIA